MAHYHLLLSFKIEYIPLHLYSAMWRRNTLLPFEHPCTYLFYTRSREKIHLPWESRNEWQIEIWVTTILAPFHTNPSPFGALIFSLEQQLKRENYTHTLYPFSGNSRNEWQIEIWVTNHFKILCLYYTWSLSSTTYYLTTQNNPVGETNSSTFSIALDDPSSILMKRLCIFAPTITPTSFLIRISYNTLQDLSNMIMTTTREKRILIWLLINYLIKLLTN